MRYSLVAFILFAALSCQALTAANEPWISHYRGNIEAEAEMAYLDNFAIELMHDPNLIGYILVYSGADSCRGESRSPRVTNDEIFAGNARRTVGPCDVETCWALHRSGY